ncbi:hypothetical protein ScPMuIL_004955 [Solemya velum]
MKPIFSAQGSNQKQLESSVQFVCELLTRSCKWWTISRPSLQHFQNLLRVQKKNLCLVTTLHLFCQKHFFFGSNCEDLCQYS